MTIHQFFLQCFLFVRLLVELMISLIWAFLQFQLPLQLAELMTASLGCARYNVFLWKFGIEESDHGAEQAWCFLWSLLLWKAQHEDAFAHIAYANTKHKCPGQ
ncbi:hypothetical protein EJB05_32820 [Eragrostis curvula]|uniref:Uncharacterized protein n=1 Tax=Eragrostis curvula TaxID=38414 RepID=A0A5J9UI06_9POAL|nr:hypothetical protein EJB05_32820 [Eragrostis curvula]